MKETDRKQSGKLQKERGREGLVHDDDKQVEQNLICLCGGNGQQAGRLIREAKGNYTKKEME